MRLIGVTCFVLGLGTVACNGPISDWPHSKSSSDDQGTFSPSRSPDAGVAAPGASGGTPPVVAVDASAPTTGTGTLGGGAAGGVIGGGTTGGGSTAGPADPESGAAADAGTAQPPTDNGASDAAVGGLSDAGVDLGDAGAGDADADADVADTGTFGDLPDAGEGPERGTLVTLSTPDGGCGLSENAGPLSSGCRDCALELMRCSVSRCLFACVSGSDEMCADCRRAHCGEVLAACDADTRR